MSNIVFAFYSFSGYMIFTTLRIWPIMILHSLRKDFYTNIPPNLRGKNYLIKITEGHARLSRILILVATLICSSEMLLIKYIYIFTYSWIRLKNIIFNVESFSNNLHNLVIGCCTNTVMINIFIMLPPWLNKDFEILYLVRKRQEF